MRVVGDGLGAWVFCAGRPFTFTVLLGPVEPRSSKPESLQLVSVVAQSATGVITQWLDNSVPPR